MVFIGSSKKKEKNLRRRRHMAEGAISGEGKVSYDTIG